jgi:hypothetical protein
MFGRRPRRRGADERLSGIGIAAMAGLHVSRDPPTWWMLLPLMSKVMTTAKLKSDNGIVDLPQFDVFK